MRGRVKKGGWGFGAMGWHWLAAAVRGQGGDAVRRAGGGLGLGRRGTRRLAGRHTLRCGAKWGGHYVIFTPISLLFEA